MSPRPNYTSIAAYLPSATSATSKPKRSPSPPRRMTQVPNWPLAARTWRAWVSYLLAAGYDLPEKDARHLKFCIQKRGYLNKAQMRWIFDIVARNVPEGCGTWGAPE